MNKQQRDYTIGRIQKISQTKHIKCECEKPSLHNHIRRAIAASTAKLKPAKEITSFFEKKILEGEDRYETKASLQDLYEPPQSYKDALAVMDRETAKHTTENNLTTAFAQRLIDRVELGEFEDGAEPILLMEAYEPKAAKSSPKK